MVLKRLLGLGSKRLRALTILGAAGKALVRGRPLRGIGLVVVAALTWKYFVVASVAQLLIGALRRADASGDEDTTGTNDGPAGADPDA
ncbi:hypothetical protein [Halalkalicoccus tibetensis]|uniref:Uncharacterized protein n=1 Tax=Halalkalicoccus tibetensis TaxID=175632 RepID=A0ABD5V7Q9_9EURY